MRILELCTPYCTLRTEHVCRVRYGVRNFGKRRVQFRWWRVRRAREPDASSGRSGRERADTDTRVNADNWPFRQRNSSSVPNSHFCTDRCFNLAFSQRLEHRGGCRQIRFAGQGRLALASANKETRVQRAVPRRQTLPPAGRHGRRARVATLSPRPEGSRAPRARVRPRREGAAAAPALGHDAALEFGRARGVRAGGVGGAARRGHAGERRREAAATGSAEASREGGPHGVPRVCCAAVRGFQGDDPEISVGRRSALLFQQSEN